MELRRRTYLDAPAVASAAGAGASHALHEEEETPTAQLIQRPSFAHIRRKRTMSVKLCGDFLIAVLEVVCANPSRHRRDIQHVLWSTNRDQYSLLVEGRQVGLAESCCRNACTMRQLREACA